jgi:hypothetical protein
MQSYLSLGAHGQDKLSSTAPQYVLEYAVFTCQDLRFELAPVIQRREDLPY